MAEARIRDMDSNVSTYHHRNRVLNKRIKTLREVAEVAGEAPLYTLDERLVEPWKNKRFAALAKAREIGALGD